MPRFTSITLAVEGPLDEVVARRLVAEVGLEAGVVHGLRGKQYLDSQLPGFNNAARFSPWLVLRDMDRDAGCAAELVARLVPAPTEHLHLRIAVHAVEAWLLADRERCAQFLAVGAEHFPEQPDQIVDPKLALVNLARRSRLRAVREDIVPYLSAKVGPAYSARLSEFVSKRWRPGKAARHSDSLARCLRSLGSLK